MKADSLMWCACNVLFYVLLIYWATVGHLFPGHCWSWWMMGKADGSSLSLLKLISLMGESLFIIHISHYFSCVKSTKGQKWVTRNPGTQAYFLPVSSSNGLCEELSFQVEVLTAGTNVGTEPPSPDFHISSLPPFLDFVLTA